MASHNSTEEIRMNITTASLTDIQRAYIRARVACRLARDSGEYIAAAELAGRLRTYRHERLVRVARQYTGDQTIGTIVETPTERHMRSLTGRPAWDTSAVA
jgi:hypothetical protein